MIASGQQLFERAKLLSTAEGKAKNDKQVSRTPTQPKKTSHTTVATSVWLDRPFSPCGTCENVTKKQVMKK